MSAPAAVGAPPLPAAAAPAAPPQAPSLFTILFQAAAVYFLYKTFLSRPSVAAPGTPLSVAIATPTPTAGPLSGALASLHNYVENVQNAGRKPIAPELQRDEAERLSRLAAAKRAGGTLYSAWPMGVAFDVRVLISTSAARAPAAAVAERGEVRSIGVDGAFDGLLLDEPPLLWRADGVAFAGDAAEREAAFNISLPASVLANASRVWAHVFFSRSGSPIDPAQSGFERTDVIHSVVPLLRFLKHKPTKPRHNLLGGDDAGASASPTPRAARFGIAVTDAERSALAAEREAAREAKDGGDATKAGAADVKLLPYWMPTLHLQLVADASPLMVSTLSATPMIEPIIQVYETGTSGGFSYTPFFYRNDFWVLNHHCVAVNESMGSPIVPLKVIYSPVAMWRWAIEEQMQKSWDMQIQLGASENDPDVMKSIFVDTNKWLLGVTIVVSLLHTIFDFLAFKNDISFWRSTKSLEGLSMRTVAINVFFQTVIFLYLLDNDTSYMILLSTGVGLAIEVWKLVRALGGTIAWAGWRPLINWSQIEVSALVSKTREYDSIAMSHLLMILYPLVVGYAIFSLFYDTHRSWYSWILSSLVSFIYMFGFAAMTPQLYINYRLKSVAHMPWKAMGYK
jgi:hypothetical protein